MAKCIKCGKELTAVGMFCDECKQFMEAYPVPTNATVILPQRSEVKKTLVKKKAVSDQEKIKRLHKAVLWLSAALLVVTVLFAITWSRLSRLQDQPQPSATETKGQNYSTQQTTPPLGDG